MTVILEAIVGSTAYGLNHSGSDIDKLGVYVEPTINLVGLDLKTERDFSIVEKDPDRTLHELGKYCRLALQCNPTVLELLWTPEDLVTTMSEDGRQLRARRDWFSSSKLVRSAYMGYAMSQFKRLSERGDFGSDLKHRTEKHARHLVRLVHQGYQFYKTGNLPVRLDPDQAKSIRSAGEEIAADPKVGEALIKYYTSLFDSVKSKLPEDNHRKEVEIWLKSIRKKH